MKQTQEDSPLQEAVDIPSSVEDLLASGYQVRGHGTVTRSSAEQIMASGLGSESQSLDWTTKRLEDTLESRGKVEEWPFRPNDVDVAALVFVALPSNYAGKGPAFSPDWDVMKAVDPSEESGGKPYQLAPNFIAGWRDQDNGAYYPNPSFNPGEINERKFDLSDYPSFGATAVSGQVELATGGEEDIGWV